MAETMKALVKSKAEPGLWLEDVPIPSVGKDDVLIRIRKTSICGTDVHIWNWDAWAQKTIPVGMTVGHEFVGATLATTMATKLLDEGIYVIGFCYPVVQQGKARIRVQISACHSTAGLDKCMDAFAKTRDALMG